MAKKRKQTQAEKEYKKQRRRIQRFIKSAEKRGYMFDQRVLPDVPKRITKASVQRLAKIRPSVLYKKAVYTTLNNEIVSGEEGRQLERKAAVKKQQRTRKIKQVDASGITKAGQPPSRTDSVLSTIEDLISRFPDGYDWPTFLYELHDRHKNVLAGMLKMQITLYGRNVVAMRLAKSTDDVVELAERIIYGDSKEEAFQIDINSFAQIIKGETLTLEDVLAIQDLADEYDV